MKPNLKFSKLALQESIDKTVKSLAQNGIEVKVAKNGQEARKIILEIIPKEAEVFTLQSMTLHTLGISREIDETGKYNSVRKKLNSMDRKTQGKEMKILGATPDFAVGSVHAITEDGHLFIASNSGSQLPADAYGAGKVIFVVGTQKIVKDNNEALKRIYEYCLPLESVRLKKIYGIPSYVSKILTIDKETTPGRITVIFVKENLGF